MLDAQTCARIVHDCHDSNLELLELLDEPSRAQMRADPAWWSAEFYAVRPVQPWTPLPPDAAQSDQLAAAALDALFRLDGQLLEAQARAQLLQRRLDDTRPAIARYWQEFLKRLRGA